MKFSNFLFPAAMTPAQDHQVIEETLREAQLCDELGMEMLWLAEHHFDGICAYVDPVAFAAALAASTKQIHIGFAVAQMSLHHPIRMAEQMSLIDNDGKGDVGHYVLNINDKSKAPGPSGTANTVYDPYSRKGGQVIDQRDPAALRGYQNTTNQAVQVP